MLSPCFVAISIPRKRGQFAITLRAATGLRFRLRERQPPRPPARGRQAEVINPGDWVATGVVERVDATQQTNGVALPVPSKCRIVVAEVVVVLTMADAALRLWNSALADSKKSGTGRPRTRIVARR